MAFTTKYTKEDLPTYSELFNEFWKEGYWQSRSFNPHDRMWQNEDPYWNIPRYKVLLATACNQFNKMMYVDHLINMRDLMRLFAFENCFELDLMDSMTIHRENGVASLPLLRYPSWRPHFAISREGYYQIPLSYNPYDKNDFMDEYHIPPIYDIRNPNGKPNPFIVDQTIKRYTVNDLQGMIEMHFIWNSSEGFYTNLGNPVDMVWDCTHPRFKSILEIFMKPIETALKK